MVALGCARITAFEHGRPEDHKRRSTLLHDRATKLSEANVHVYSDSVVFLGKIHEHPTSMQKWKDRIGWFNDPKDYEEFNGIDAEPVEFDLNLFTAHPILDLFQEIQRKMVENRTKPEEFKDRNISFMTMYNDIDWTKDQENFKT